jgi:membrane-associated phospholipid phosphatase
MAADGDVRAPAPARVALAPNLRHPAIFLAAVGAVLLVVPALVLAGQTGPSRLDRWVQHVVDDSPSGVWRLVLGLDWLGEPVGRTVMTIAVATLCLITGRRLLAVTAALAMMASAVLSSLLKYVVDRQIHGGFLSYPSGHTAAAAVAATILGLLLADLLRTGRIAGTAVTLVFSVLGGGLMACAQIHLNAHYPTDTLGGYGCGLLAVAPTAFVVEQLARMARRPASR